MKFSIEVGAPSLAGKGAIQKTEAAVAGVEYPCDLVVTNHMPRAAVFPESGVELASAFSPVGRSAMVTFGSKADLERLIRIGSQVAELNGYALALLITDGPAPEATQPEAAQPEAAQPEAVIAEAQAATAPAASGKRSKKTKEPT